MLVGVSVTLGSGFRLGLGLGLEIVLASVLRLVFLVSGGRVTFGMDVTLGSTVKVKVRAHRRRC